MLNKVAKSVKGKRKWQLDDASDKTFKELFKILNILSENKIVQFEDFFSKNQNLVQYFKIYNNIDNFSQTIEKVRKNIKIKIRDYYLTLIHHIGDKSYYPDSPFLSVTTDLRIAERFSKDNNDKIILFGWLPLNRLCPDYAVTFDYLNSIDEKLEEMNLPTYIESFYPEENEISLKGGLLPHYLIGYFYLDRNSAMTFEINPNILKIPNNSTDWIEKGLPIDQSGFWITLKNTNIKGSFWVNQAGDYWNEDI